MIRKANMEEPPAIASLVNHYAAKSLMLPLSLQEIYEHLRDFFVFEQNGEVFGCVAFHLSWKDLAEIRSLAVQQDHQRKGIGSGLVEACLEEGRRLQIKRVFTLTYEGDFFKRFGFRQYPKEELPHKIWSECLKCPRFPDCDEEAYILSL